MELEKNIKCTVSYNGTNFNGWQVQNDLRTVQAEIELAIFKIAKEKIKIVGAGRTDKGVHAKGQTFNFKTSLNMDGNNWKRALNTNLPMDIRIVDCEIVSNDFHSRFSNKGKVYEYLLNTDEFDPLTKDLIYQYEKELDISSMQHAANLFIGTHDFRNFCSNSLEEVKDFVKTIKSFDISIENKIVKFRVEGSGFLRYQVRMMVGALIEIGAKRKDESIILERLDSSFTNVISYNAPANGLYLVKVFY